MAIKSGQVVHAGNGITVIDRIQSAGPGQLNIPTETIYEVGNYKSVAKIRDTPDLTFNMESLDCSTEVEQMLTRLGGGHTVVGVDYDSVADTLVGPAGSFTAADLGRQIEVRVGNVVLDSEVAAFVSGTTVEIDPIVIPAGASATGLSARVIGDGIELSKSLPLDIASQFKPGEKASGPFVVAKAVALPFLVLEQMSYRFGLRDNASQSATLRGDTIFYCPGPVYVEEAVGTGVAGQTVVTVNPAYQVADGDERRILSVTVGDKRLTAGVDYTEAVGVIAAGAGIVTVTLIDPVPAASFVRIMYASPTSMSYPQAVHANTLVKPAAVRGRDIEIYLGGYDPADRAGSQVNKLTMVQSVNLDWRATIEKDEEFGNYYAVAQDADVPTVGGTIDVKPRDVEDMFRFLRRSTGVTDVQKVMSTNSTVAIPLDIVIKHPDTGRPIKRLHVDDARITPPGYDARVQQKTTLQLQMESDEGTLVIFDR